MKTTTTQKPIIRSIYGNEGIYLKADRKSSYSILFQTIDGRKLWLRTWEVKSVNFKGNDISPERFCNLLLIPYKAGV